MYFVRSFPFYCWEIAISYFFIVDLLLLKNEDGKDKISPYDVYVYSIIYI